MGIGGELLDYSVEYGCEGESPPGRHQCSWHCLTRSVARYLARDERGNSEAERSHG